MARLSELVQGAYGHYVDRIGGEPRPMVDDYTDVISRHRVTVAEADGTILGLIVLALDDNDLWIDNVAVDPIVHGTGIGRALLEHAESVARTDGHTELWLLTHELMTENRNLYTRIGYTERNRQPLPDGSALIHMAKNLKESSPGIGHT